MRLDILSLVLGLAVIAGCEQTARPKTDKTGDVYDGIYETQVNALKKAEQVGVQAQQAEDERKQQLEQATQ